MGTRESLLSLTIAALVVFCGFAVVGAAEELQVIAMNEEVYQSGRSPGMVDLTSEADTPTALEQEFLMVAPPAAQPDEAFWVSEAGDSDLTSEVAANEGASGLEITVTTDWVSKYMFRGFDILDDRGAWQPGVDLGLWDTGLHLNWWASYASSSRNDHGLVANGLGRELDEHDYTVYWEGGIADVIDVEVGMIYYDFVRQNSENLDYWEWYGVFTLSEVPLSPYFGAYYGRPKRGSHGGEGWNTTLGVSHSVELGGLTFCGSDPLALDLAADVWYNGGQYHVDTGWTHATFGSSITFPLAANLSFTPGVWYQVSMEDDVNDEDEWWATLSLEYSW